MGCAEMGGNLHSLEAFNQAVEFCEHGWRQGAGIALLVAEGENTRPRNRALRRGNGIHGGGRSTLWSAG